MRQRLVGSRRARSRKWNSIWGGMEESVVKTVQFEDHGCETFTNKTLLGFPKAVYLPSKAEPTEKYEQFGLFNEVDYLVFTRQTLTHDVVDRYLAEGSTPLQKEEQEPPVENKDQQVNRLSSSITCSETGLEAENPAVANNPNSPLSSADSNAISLSLSVVQAYHRAILEKLRARAISLMQDAQLDEPSQPDQSIHRSNSSLTLRNKPISPSWAAAALATPARSASTAGRPVAGSSIPMSSLLGEDNVPNASSSPPPPPSDPPVPRWGTLFARRRCLIFLIISVIAGVMIPVGNHFLKHKPERSEADRLQGILKGPHWR